MSHIKIASKGEMSSMAKYPLPLKNADKNRPLLIKCFNKNKNWKFIRDSKNLKLQDQEDVKIWTTPDCTKKEKEERKRL